MLKFIRVTKKYNEDKTALDNVSFDIDSGELVVITGPSGSGKTTLLKLLTKEQDPTEGEIYFKEENVNSLRRSKVPYHRRRIGAIFQDYKLLPELNIWENIALALSILGHPDQEIEEKVTDLLKLVGLTDRAYLFPHQLSGGEAQRISIARALSTAPELIFADEPTGNLDSANSLIIAKLLKKINDLGTTVMITTHDPVVIKALPKARVMELKDGILTDSASKKTEKEKGDKAEEEKEKKKKKERETLEEVKEENKEADNKKSENNKNQESKKDKEQPVKKKISFNFFGLFAKRKKQEKEAEVAKGENKDRKDDSKKKKNLEEAEGEEKIVIESLDEKESPKNKNTSNKKVVKSKKNK